MTSLGLPTKAHRAARPSSEPPFPGLLHAAARWTAATLHELAGDRARLRPPGVPRATERGRRRRAGPAHELSQELPSEAMTAEPFPSFCTSCCAPSGRARSRCAALRSGPALQSCKARPPPMRCFAGCTSWQLLRSLVRTAELLYGGRQTKANFSTRRQRNVFTCAVRRSSRQQPPRAW